MIEPFPFSTVYCDEPEAVLRKGEYHDGSIALRLFTPLGETLCTATVCMSYYNETPAEDCVFIRDHDENAGVLEALLQAGIVGMPQRALDTPRVPKYAYECELLVALDDIDDI
jgi:hypothetical protein